MATGLSCLEKSKHLFKGLDHQGFVENHKPKSVYCLRLIFTEMIKSFDLTRKTEK